MQASFSMWMDEFAAVAPPLVCVPTVFIMIDLQLNILNVFRHSACLGVDGCYCSW